jgi:hypothetical protein
VRVLDQGDVTTIDTPNTQLQLNRAGLYRIDVDPDRQSTTLVVREGEAMVALANGSQQALPGQMLTVEGADATYADVRNAAGVDGFDTWSANRDRYYQRGRAVAYVSPQMVGYADLDRNGVWETSPTYGAVWYPTSVVADWAPYRFGHWTWVSGFGYAWVDDAPWGYAPFHYGRWVFVGNRWGWCPGHYVARPVWAPALVGWYGGSGWSVSLRTGAPVYGWVPLAWGEPFHPWWGRCSHNCWTRYNRPYAVNVAERPQRPPSTYVNLRVPGAITAVTGATLAASKPVAINRVPIQAGSPPPVLSSAPPIRPLRVATPAIRGGTGGAPKPASSLYREARPRITPTPSAVAPSAPNAPVMRSIPPSARGTTPVAPAPGITAVPGSPSPAAAPRVVERPREGMRQERVVPPTSQAPVAPGAPPTATPRVEPKPRVVPPASQAPVAPVAPPTATPRVEPKPRVVPRQEGIAVPPTPTPAPSIRAAPAAPAPAVRAAPPAPAPAVRAVPATPPPSPPVVQRESHPRGQPAAGAEHGEKANANPRGGPQEQPK